MQKSEIVKEAAAKELAKVAIAYKMLNLGMVSTMSDKDFERFMEWLK